MIPQEYIKVVLGVLAILDYMGEPVESQSSDPLGVGTTPGAASTWITGSYVRLFFKQPHHVHDHGSLKYDGVCICCTVYPSYIPISATHNKCKEHLTYR